MIYQNFKLSDIDGAMLEWDELLQVELKGDNLQQFQNDWDSTCLSVKELPDARFKESLYRKQLEKSDQLKQTMQLYWQDITQRGESKSYDKLKGILGLHLERRKLE